MFQRLLQFCSNFELFIANINLLCLVVILGLQVFFRYVLQTGLTWSEEISRFSFVWFVYISASLAAQKGTHVRVTMMTKLFPGGQRWCLLIADIIWIIFNMFVVVSGVLLLVKMYRYPVYSTALFIPLVYVYSVIPLAHTLMIVRIVERQWQAFKQGRTVLANHS